MRRGIIALGAAGLLTAAAAVGAAIAGSTIWQRRQARIETEAALAGELEAESPAPRPST